MEDTLSIANPAELLSLSQQIVSCRTRLDVQNLVAGPLARYFQFNEIMICLNNADNLTHTNYAYIVKPETMRHPDFTRGQKLKYFINDGIHNIIADSPGPLVMDMDDLIEKENKPFYIDFWYKNRIRELIGFPVRINGQPVGAAYLYARAKGTFSESQLQVAQAVISFVGITIANIIALEKMQVELEDTGRERHRLAQENEYLQEEVKAAHHGQKIIGAGNGLRKVLAQMTQVMSSDTTVLIQGETGTGKELIARALHNDSPRSKKMMVKLNCAALPANLIESELFGHEKGSFTDATERRIGKFELANKSTLFLDEIGEMAPELQVKLLRALQEKEIERIGGREVLHVDVRIIAATNRDLLKDVEAGRFRSDLYYRLNVFPIELPPLRLRKEDIPLLVAHFTELFARKLGKRITGVSPEAVQSMMVYHWPGNVRELEHVIERSVILTTGNLLEKIYLPIKEEPDVAADDSDQPIKTLEELERDHLAAVLKICDGRVRGPGGAAELLKLPPTTLASKLKKFGIR